jgi:hypothetical protein
MINRFKKQLVKFSKNPFMFISLAIKLKGFLSPVFWKDYYSFKGKNNRFQMSFFDFYPCPNDKTKETAFDAHYIYHVAWASRKIKESIEKKHIKKHIDFSSSLHFCTNISAVIPVEFYDYRPVALNLSQLKTGRADITRLKNFQSNSISSLSCMHVVEHIGLGRYGDTIDPNGDIKAIQELKRVCMKNGNILFVVPVGKEKIMFNAHRIYAFETILKLFGKDFLLQEFALVTDSGTFIENINIRKAHILVMKQNYGCGCFLFLKK